MLFQSHNHCPVCQNEGITWCEAKDWEYCTSDKTYSYLQCTQCNTIFIKEVPHLSLSEIYPDNYYSFTGKTGSLVFKLKNRLEQGFYTSVFKTLNHSSLSVLDIGGGTGELLTSLKQADKRILYSEIVDINEAAMKSALLKGHAFTLSTIEAYIPQQKFHVILLLNLIEHIADPAGILKKIERMLYPGGVMIIKTPNSDSLDAKIFKASYWGGLHSPRHWVIFSEKSFRLILKNTGLTIAKLKYTQGGPFWAFSIIVYLARKNILVVNKERPVIFHPLFAIISSLFAGFDFLRRPFAKTSQQFFILQRND